MNVFGSKNVTVSHALSGFSGGVEGLMCEREDRYRIGHYLAEQGYEEEWETHRGRHERVAVLKVYGSLRMKKERAREMSSFNGSWMKRWSGTWKRYS